MNTAYPILAVTMLLASSPPAAAMEPPPPGAAATLPPSPSLLRSSSVSSAPNVQAPLWRFVISNLLVLRLNPVGLEDQIRIGFQRRLPESDQTQGRLFRDRFVFFGLAPRINPAFIKIGPSIEIQPLSILNLRIGAEYIGLFSTFGFLQSYPSAADEYSDKLLGACSSPDPETQKKCSYRDGAGTLITGIDERRNYSAHGFHLMVEPLVQLKLGPLAFRNKLALEYWYMNVRDGDRVFYDVTLDTLVPARGWVLANDLDLLFVTKFGLTAGVRYSVVLPFYSNDEIRLGESLNTLDNGHQRIGPVISYTFYDRGFTRFNKPTLLLIAGWYLDHRYRTGQAAAAILPGVFVQSQAMPYLVIGFSFQSDLIKATAVAPRPVQQPGA